MSGSNRRAYADYRPEKAEETYEAALVLFENAQWNSVVNRLYYASFYAIGASMATSNIETEAHSGAKTQFLLYFIKTKKISAVYGKLFADLFDRRQKGGYGDFFNFQEQNVKPLSDRQKDQQQKSRKKLTNPFSEWLLQIETE